MPGRKQASEIPAIPEPVRCSRWVIDQKSPREQKPAATTKKSNGEKRASRSFLCESEQSSCKKPSHENSRDSDATSIAYSTQSRSPSNRDREITTVKSLLVTATAMRENCIGPQVWHKLGCSRDVGTGWMQPISMTVEQGSFCAKGSSRLCSLRTAPVDGVGPGLRGPKNTKCSSPRGKVRDSCSGRSLSREESLNRAIVRSPAWNRRGDDGAHTDWGRGTSCAMGRT